MNNGQNLFSDNNNNSKSDDNVEQIDSIIKRANACLEDANVHDAHTILMTAYRKDKSSPELLNELGKIYLYLGYPKRALHYFEKGLLQSRLNVPVNEEIQRKL